MLKRSQSSSISSISSCSNVLQTCLFLIGGLTIGVDLYVFSASSWWLLPRPNTVFRSKQLYDKQSRNHASKPRGKEYVLQLLKEANMTVDDAATIQQLPTWEQVISVWGESPVIIGLESCAVFRKKVPQVRRMLGAAGMFSTGTNLITHLLKQNCIIPARQEKYGPKATKEDLGMRWQVPWGKHTDPAYRDKHATIHAQAINKDDILPVVTIRNAWTWMQSMCRNPYTARWSHYSQCPNLRSLQNNHRHHWNNVTVKYGAGTESYQSLVHLWNDWYRSYMEHATYPLVMIRIEDLVFHTKATVTQVCECVGGFVPTDRPFHYVEESAKKDSPGHDTRTGYVEAWIKYSKPFQVEAGFAHDDYEATLEGVDHDLMDTFHYHHPMARNNNDEQG